MVTVLIAVIPAVTATGVLCVFVVQNTDTSLSMKILGMGNIILGITVVICYVIEELSENYSIFVPGLQKLILITLIIWIVMLVKESDWSR